MKKIISLLFITFILSSFILHKKIDKELIIDTKWCLDGKLKTAIYFKHDNTLWHYYPSNIKADSLMLCDWEINTDKICFYNHGENKEFLYFQVVSCSKKTLFIKDPKTGDLIKYINYKFIDKNAKNN